MLIWVEQCEHSIEDTQLELVYMGFEVMNTYFDLRTYMLVLL